MPRITKDLRPPYGEGSFMQAAGRLEDILLRGEAEYLRDLLEAAAAWAALGERFLAVRQQNIESVKRRRRRAKEANVQALQQ